MDAHAFVRGLAADSVPEEEQVTLTLSAHGIAYTAAQCLTRHASPSRPASCAHTLTPADRAGFLRLIARDFAHKLYRTLMARGAKCAKLYKQIPPRRGDTYLDIAVGAAVQVLQKDGAGEDAALEAVPFHVAAAFEVVGKRVTQTSCFPLVRAAVLQKCARCRQEPVYEEALRRVAPVVEVILARRRKE